MDGLAHNRREVSKHEIQATTKSIHQDFRDLVNLLAEKEVRGAVYLVSDHGILWKNQHDFQVLECNDKKHPRYATSDLLQPEYTTKFATQLQEFYLWQYPFLGRSIKKQ
ncbi:MAG: hypothetical protein H6633_12700 [Anaerolineales bacterium]|nr:hypothetical protein [Anaerolineales bacterium]